MISDEEFQARIKAWADANTIHFVEMSEHLRKFGEKLTEAVQAVTSEKESQDGAQSE